MPTWVHVGANIGPCWLKKTVLAGLGPFWRPLGPSCLEAGGGLGGRNCKGIDPRGVLRRFEASSRPLGGDQLLTCLPRARFWGGPNRVLSEASSLNPRPLKGIQPKGSSLNAGHTVGASPVADFDLGIIWGRFRHRKSICFRSKNRNPTSPLGLGGLANLICFQPLFPTRGRVYPSPYPALEIPSRS